MIKFAYTEYLYLLFIIPIIVFSFIIYIKWQKHALSKFTDNHLIEKICLNRSIIKRNIKYITLILVIMMMILGLANPRIGKGTKKITRKGVEIMIALDVSKSMDCKDLHQKYSRLELAKQSILKLINELNEDKIGLITFAGEAENLIPLSSNYLGMSPIISNINTSSLVSGTDIGLAISESIKSFDFTNQVNKTIIIISDGENRKDGAIDTTKIASDKGIIINTVCVGSKDGGYIPEYDNNGNLKYKRINGELVKTIPDRNMLAEIAEYGDGSNINIEGLSTNLKSLLNNIDKIKKTEMESYEWNEFIDRFQIFLFIAFILLITEIVILERKIN